MKQVNIYEAKTQLSKLIGEVTDGEEVIIAKAGTPVARLVPWKGPTEQRKPGRLKGRARVKKSFDDPLPTDLFEDPIS